MNHTARLQLRDSCVCGGVSVERDPLRGAMPLYRSRKETLSCCNISTLAQQEVDREPLPIDSAVEVTPSPKYSDVRFVHPPRSADRSSVAAPTFLELRDIALNPSENSRMRDVDAALGHHAH